MARTVTTFTLSYGYIEVNNKVLNKTISVRA